MVTSTQNYPGHHVDRWETGDHDPTSESLLLLSYLPAAVPLALLGWFSLSCSPCNHLLPPGITGSSQLYSLWHFHSGLPVSQWLLTLLNTLLFQSLVPGEPARQVCAGGMRKPELPSSKEG